MPKYVREIDSPAICGERKQTPRVHVTHRKHPKSRSLWKQVWCLGCKRSRVQIPAARPSNPFQISCIGRSGSFGSLFIPAQFPHNSFSSLPCSPAAAQDGVSPASAGPPVRAFLNRQRCTRRSSTSANVPPAPSLQKPLPDKIVTYEGFVSNLSSLSLCALVNIAKSIV